MKKKVKFILFFVLIISCVTLMPNKVFAKVEISQFEPTTDPEFSIKDDGSGGGSSGTSSTNENNLTNKDYTLECIYDDGALFTYEYSAGKNKFQHNKLTYNLVGTSHQSSVSDALVFVNALPIESYGNYSPDSNNGYKQPLKCAQKVYSTNYDGATYYKFSYDFEKCKNNTCSELNASTNGWCKFWDCDDDYDAAKNAIKRAVSAKLVSERYILNYNYPEPNKVFYYVLSAEQAAGVNAYIKFMVYDNTILLEKDDRVTEISSSTTVYNDLKDAAKNGKNPKYTTVYINSPEPMPVASSASSIAYKFNYKKFDVVTNNENFSDYTKYVYTEDFDEGDKIDNSLCTERLKNTSPILKNLIKYMQILIPAIVLIITGIEIGKIVVSGNLEEELPKRKKMIITRIIIMLVFFFLPFFVKLFITLIKSSGIGENNAISDGIQYIDCLFDADAKAGIDTSDGDDNTETSE